jgi:hypothetical protein
LAPEANQTDLVLLFEVTEWFDGFYHFLIFYLYEFSFSLYLQFARALSSAPAATS